MGMQMPGGIPDYDQFMKMTPAQRKNLLKVVGWVAGKQIQPLLMLVFERDPDPEIRQMARQMLEKQGVQIRVEGGDPRLTAEPRSDALRAPESPMRDGGVGIPVTDDLSRRAAEALKRGQGTPQSPSSQVGGPSLADSGATVYYTTTHGTVESPFSGPDTLDGGTGRALQRNQNFPNVFLLYPRNLKYVRGEVEKPTTSTGTAAWVGIVIFFVVFSMISAASGLFFIADAPFVGSNFDPEMLLPFGFFGLIFGIIFLIVVVSWVRNQQRMTRLAASGQVYLGQVVYSNGRWVSSGSGSSRSSSYRVTVRYVLRLPDGRTVNGEATATRGDLARKALPLTGSPVAVLYASEDDQMLL